MRSIQHALALARARLFYQVWLTALGWAALAALTAGTAVLALYRLVAIDLSAHRWTYPGIAIAAFLAAPIYAWVRRPSSPQAATLLDQRLQLKDRLGTALYARNRPDDPFAVRALEDAEKVASGVRVSQAFPLRFEKVWVWVPVSIALAALLFFFLPDADLAGFKEAAARRVAQDNEAKARKEDLIQAMAAVQQLDERTGKPRIEGDPNDLANQLAELSKQDLNSPEARAKAAATLSSVQDRLGDAAQKKEEEVRTVENTLSGLDPKTPGPADKFADALRRGDFKEAQKALDELANALDGMSGPDRDALKQQLDNLAQQLAQAAAAQAALQQQQQQAIQQMLQNAGLTPQQIQQLQQQGMNPQAVQQAVAQAQQQQAATQPAQQQQQPQSRPAQQQQPQSRPAQQQQPQSRPAQQQQPQSRPAQQQQPQSRPAQQQSSANSRPAQMSPQQVAQQVQQMQQQGGGGNQQSQQSMQQMSQAMRQMSQSMQQQGGQQGAQSRPSMPQGMSQMQQQLNQLGQMQQQLQQMRQAQQALQQAQQGMAGGQGGQQGQGGAGMGGQGQGIAGGRGQGGVGGSPPGTGSGGNPMGRERLASAHNTSSESDAHEHAGRIIASWNQNGDMAKGAPTVEFDRAVTQAKTDAEKAVTEDRVPRRYHEAIRKYFDQLPQSPDEVKKTPAAPR